jgi:hypothetical protein
VSFPQGIPFTCEWRLTNLHVLRVPTRQVALRAAAETGIDPADFHFDSLAPNSAGSGCARGRGWCGHLEPGRDQRGRVRVA